MKPRGELCGFAVGWGRVIRLLPGKALLCDGCRLKRAKS